MPGEKTVEQLRKEYKKKTNFIDNDGKCPHCKFLNELFGNLKDGTEREYWIMTEMMVYLHGGSDVCNYGKDQKSVFKNFK